MDGLLCTCVVDVNARAILALKGVRRSSGVLRCEKGLGSLILLSVMCWDPLSSISTVLGPLLPPAVQQAVVAGLKSELDRRITYSHCVNSVQSQRAVLQCCIRKLTPDVCRLSASGCVQWGVGRGQVGSKPAVPGNACNPQRCFGSHNPTSEPAQSVVAVSCVS